METRLEETLTKLAASVHEINTGLFVSGLWVGLVSMAVIWFVFGKTKEK